MAQIFVFFRGTKEELCGWARSTHLWMSHAIYVMLIAMLMSWLPSLQEIGKLQITSQVFTKKSPFWIARSLFTRGLNPTRVKLQNATTSLWKLRMTPLKSIIFRYLRLMYRFFFLEMPKCRGRPLTGNMVKLSLKVKVQNVCLLELVNPLASLFRT